MKEEIFLREFVKIFKIYWIKEFYFEFIKILEEIINDNME